MWVFFLKNYGGINLRDKSGMTTLHLAIVGGYMGIVRFLLQNGANPDLKNSVGHPPLHLAVTHGNKSAVILMLKKSTTCAGDKF